MSTNKTDYNFLFKRAAKERGYIVFDKKDLKEAVAITTEAFDDYPLYHYFTPNYSREKWINLKWRIFKSIFDDAVIFTDHTRSCCAVVMCNNYEKTKTSKYIFNGLIKSYFSIGAKAIKRLSEYEDFVTELRKKHTNYNCIYCFDLAVKKSEQGKGIGHGINNLLQDFSNEHGLDIYFETHSAVNENIYKKLGYTLIEKVPLPWDKKIINCCFMYKHKTNKK